MLLTSLLVHLGLNDKKKKKKIFSNLNCAYSIMCEEQDEMFEIKEHEENFNKLCKLLKRHQFESPWTLRHHGCNDDSINEVKELSIPNELQLDINHDNCNLEKCVGSTIDSVMDFKSNVTTKNLTLTELRESLIATQNNQDIEILNGIEVLHSISPAQVLQLKEQLKECFLHTAALTSFLKSVMNLEKPLSLSVVCAIVQQIIYIQVFENKQSSRSLLTAVLNFCEMYPKPVIDEILVPCLKKEDLETLQMETLTKMAKTAIPDDYVTHAVRGLTEVTTMTDNNFTVLQILVERKVRLEENLHDILALKLKDSSNRCCKDLKFIKLVISILTVFGSELSRQQIAVYTDIVQENGTIMKRAAENVLKKLKM